MAGRSITRRDLLKMATQGIGTAVLWDSLPLPATPSSIPRRELLPIPDGLVVLNFDDGIKSDISHVAPVLKHHGFGASFYVTEGLSAIRADNALTWDDIRKLNDDGFEIGNHTKNHLDVTKLSKEQFSNELNGIEARCSEFGIPVPTTFVYPGFRDNLRSAEVLLTRGYDFARRGVRPEFPDGDRGARGPVYNPEKHHPLLLPTTGYAGPNWNFEDLIWAIDQAKNGQIAILCFHGVPYPRAPWVSVEPHTFDKYMEYLRDRRCTVIATRDLAKYARSAKATEIPLHREKGKFS